MGPRMLFAVVALLSLAHIGSATAEQAYKWHRTSQDVRGGWYTLDSQGMFYVSVQESPDWGYWGLAGVSYSDGLNYVYVYCDFFAKGPFIVNRQGSGLETAVLTLDSTQDGVFCSEPIQAHIVLTAAPDTGGLLHSNGSEKIQGHQVVVQTMKRFWGVSAAGNVGDLQLPADATGTLEVEDWYSMTK